MGVRICRNTFQIAWDGYHKYAFPHDSLMPVTNKYADERNGWGASAVDAFSTALIMENWEVADEILEHIGTINFASTSDEVNLFETTIRYLGSMLSGYDLLTGPLKGKTSKPDLVSKVLDQARTLAELLKVAFQTPTGIPDNHLLFDPPRRTNSTTNGIATIGTLIMEWTRLSDLLQDPEYGALAARGMSYLLDPLNPEVGEPFPGLLGTRVNISNGHFVDGRGGWVGGDDSYYEYLIKMFLYDPGRFAHYRDRWVEAANSSMKYLASHPSTRPDLTFLAIYNNQTLSFVSQHLACFNGGNFILGGLTLQKPAYVDFGLALVDGCHETYAQTVTGIGPEIFQWQDGRREQIGASNNPGPQKPTDAAFYAKTGFWITDSSYVLRPEVLESYYYAYRATGDAKYQEWAWEGYLAINRTTHVGSGYSDIKNVNVAGGGGFDDFQESFFFAEVLKYAFLIHADDAPYQVKADGTTEFVFNTEAHPLRLAGAGPIGPTSCDPAAPSVPTPTGRRSYSNTMSQLQPQPRPRRPTMPLASLPSGIGVSFLGKSRSCYVAAVDQGTTSTRFIIFDGLGTPVAGHQIEFENLYPHPGHHEQDPHELLRSVQDCMTEALRKFEDSGHDKADIRCLGITNQRETTLVWDQKTGEPLYNAVVWPDTRATSLVHDLKARPGADELLELCGLPLSTYPSSVKLMWLLGNVDQVKSAYRDGRLAFGTVDSWLVYRLNGGASAEKPVHVTDSTNASRTMFMNLRTLQYDEKLLEFFGIDRTRIQLPTIVPSSDPECFGRLAYGPLKGVSIAGCLGDQSSALVGQCGFQPGQAKNTYGTGCFLLYNVGHEPVISQHGLLATVGYDFGRGRKPVYALEGSIAVAGAGVNFLVRNLGFDTDSGKITALAETVKDNGGVVFVTAFSGLFAPYWIDDAKGTLFGITQHTSKGHIARATLEATCFQTKAILDAMERDSGKRLANLAVDGGLSNSDLCMQTQADLSGISVDRPAMRETTALGAAIAAGLATGVWNELEDLKDVHQGGRRIFTPQISRRKADRLFLKWEQAVEMSRGWVRDVGALLDHQDDD
ncbi:hypothetical protein P8C59_007775 [Phyllachora maydis]|uniref:alpha-1,2-Mannosidase n=1 Tax=Phyllachora maydis TaxID=1825666 RepID=A0AAD9IAD7_9PEZI|nr:hypothetical protein P8C59_007775 [Phyllachora maydis]